LEQLNEKKEKKVCVSIFFADLKWPKRSLEADLFAITVINNRKSNACHIGSLPG
jgi:hypothetical protein